MSSLALVTLVVRDYDEAIAYYTRVLGFRLVEDRPLGADKRWVVVAPACIGETGAERGHGDATDGELASADRAHEPRARGAALLLAKAANPAQQARIGDQTGGRVCLFLETDDFARDYERMRARGVVFTELPREERYGTVAVFVDLYGNRWDLLQPRTRPMQRASPKP